MAKSALDPLTVHLGGGVGNQLFTYAAGLWLADAYSRTLKVDGSRARLETQGSIFDLELNISRKEFHASMRKRLLRRRFRWWSKVFRSVGAGPRGVYWAEAGFDPNLVGALEKGAFGGFLQTHFYVGELKRTASFSRHFASLLPKRPPDGPEVVNLHIRRGDFSSRLHRLLTVDYYREALAEVSRSSGSHRLNVNVFSDDSHAARDVLWSLRNDHQFTFRHAESANAARSALIALAEAHWIVISNSTFSWWAAALANEQTRIIAPASLTCQESAAPDRYPPNWQTISASWLCGAGKQQICDDVKMP